MRVIYNKVIPFKGFKCVNLFGVLFVREGCLRDIWNGTFGHRAALTAGEQTRTVLTSAPALLSLLVSLYFILRNLEAL